MTVTTCADRCCTIEEPWRMCDNSWDCEGTRHFRECPKHERTDAGS